LSKPPNLKQLAVLDWLRRWPSLTLRKNGRWPATWASEAARLQSKAVVYTLFGVVPPETTGGKDGWGTFDATPHCGSATLRVLLSRGWLKDLGEGNRRGECYQISPDGLTALHRYCFRLKDYAPRYAGARQSRPIQPSAKLLKRYGGPDAARNMMVFHQRQAAYHARIAERIKVSLELYQDSPEQRADDWAARKRAKGRR
jgi:hypothetical protein